MGDRWRWYPSSLSGWLIVNRFLGLRWDFRSFVLGIVPRSYEVRIMLGFLTVMVHLDGDPGDTPP